MFPQVGRREVLWDLQRNGGSVAATSERILSGGLERVSYSSLFWGARMGRCWVCWGRVWSVVDGGEEQRKLGEISGVGWSGDHCESWSLLLFIPSVSQKTLY